MAERILVVDDDPDVARFVEVNLRSAGYDVDLASDGEEALRKAVEVVPDLVLLDVMMPRMDGFEVARRLRRDPRTSMCTIIMLTAKALASDKVVGLAAGADDYIIKPFDPVELLARVKGTLRRAREMRALSPLTGLPGNVRVQEEIGRRVAEGEPFALLYIDLDHFKPFNDHYGWVRGDRVIQTLARLVVDVVQEVTGPQGFVGHVGGDDFVAVVATDTAETVAKELCRRFDEAVPLLYDTIDRERGGIEVPDRQGKARWFPFLSLSIGVATTAHRRFEHYGEAVAVATEMKHVAKRTPGSCYAVDRRRG
ncbi:MAG TPA: response regulator [Actinomycetota bacterium]|nr:response regulator [Actinomycetota bacterium]